MNVTHRYTGEAIGQPVERVEDLRLLRGAGKYVDDLHVEGMLHASVMRSSMAHGRIKSIDIDAALTMPGVKAVLTADDVVSSLGAVPTIPMRRGPLEGLGPFEQPVIAVGKVRYVGEPLAIVIAETQAEAEDAADAIFADIDMLPPLKDRWTSQSSEVLMFEESASNTAITYKATRGDFSALDAPYRRREKFSVHRHTAVSMETRGLMADWGQTTHDKLTVAGAAKAPFATRRILAKCLQLAPELIDMLEYDVGGGFGVRGDFYPEDFLVPFAARQLGRPVKWIEDRRENLLGSSHAREADCEIEIACALDGEILGLTASVFIDMGAYIRNAAEVAPRNAALFLSGPYRVPNIYVESSMVLTNKSPVGTYRGPGRFEGDFFRERLFDMAARDLGLDTVAFRRRNLVRESDMPYSIAAISPLYGESPVAFDGGEYSVAMDRCLEEIKWSERAPDRGRLIDGLYHGMGVGCFVESGGSGPKETAKLSVDRHGEVSVFVGSSNIGQGLETVCTQIAADALSVSMDRIRVFHGSTTLLKEGIGSFASRSVIMGGSAILDAAEKLKTELRALAGRRLNCSIDDVRIGEGLHASFEGRTIELSDLIEETLSVDGAFVSNIRTYAYGCAAAYVTVDPKTGRVELLDYVMVEDVGRIINPLTVNGQAIGALVQGLGGVFLEHLQYDEDCQLITGSLADYLLPTATDFPNVRAIELEIARSPTNPLGAKGAGEGGVIPVGGVISNAVASALSSLHAEPRSLPLSPGRVWQLIQDSRAEHLSER